MIRTLLLCLLLAGCGALRQKSVSAPALNPRRADLQAAYDQKLAALEAAADRATGWPSATDCDSTLWAGEAAAAGDAKVQLSLAEQAPGEIHRRPKASGECYPKGSSSTISRDMLVGYIAGAFARQDRAALERLYDYGHAHAWVMGTGPASETFFTPDGQGVLARAIKALGGASHAEAAVPLFCATEADYALHIQTVGTLLDAAASGATDELCAGQAAASAKANPKDALMQAAAGVFSGDMSAATDLLLDPGYLCPSYVRGAPLYCAVQWLFAAHVVLQHSEGN